MVSAVIFDIDGTLIDSVDIHAQAWVDAFEKFGKSVPFADVRGQIGKGGDQLLPVFLSPEELQKFGKDLEEFRGDHYKKNYMHRVKPFAMVRELFLRIKGEGLQIALASSAKEDELNYYREITQIGDLVEASTSADDAEKSKPHPDIFEAAVDRLGVNAHQTVVVGDSPYDAIAAGKMGVRTIGMACGGFSDSELQSAGCVEIYRSPSNLLFEYHGSQLRRR